MRIIRIKKLITKQTISIVFLLTASGPSIALVNTAKPYSHFKPIAVINGSANQTYSIAKYTQGFMPNIGQLLETINKNRMNEAAKIPTKMTFNDLPIKTPNMSFGKVQARKINFPQLIYPIFLVGSDEGSLQWLVQYAPKLKELHAVGLLVQANTKNNINSVNQAANGVPVVPASGYQVAKRLGIKHYPVFISKHLIEQ